MGALLQFWARPAEAQAMKAKARALGLSFSGWARGVLTKAAKKVVR